MREILAFYKETERKWRWDADVEGTPFELYIPKWRVPEPVPKRIKVKIYLPNEVVEYKQKYLVREINRSPDLRMNKIYADVTYLREHTQTVRYDPIGDDKNWEIGSPYIPKSILPVEFPSTLQIIVEWLY